jgi:hypothetical protein
MPAAFVPSALSTYKYTLLTPEPGSRTTADAVDVAVVLVGSDTSVTVGGAVSDDGWDGGGVGAGVGVGGGGGGAVTGPQVYDCPVTTTDATCFFNSLYLESRVRIDTRYVPALSPRVMAAEYVLSKAMESECVASSHNWIPDTWRPLESSM